MTPPISIGGDDVSEITVGGEQVQEVTADGDVVWAASDPPTDGLVLHYSMDSATISGDTLTDESSYNNDGTINGATTGVTGVENEALYFDGTDDNVSVPHDASLNVGSGLTLSLWTYRTGRGGVNPRIWQKESFNSGYSFLQDGSINDGDQSMSFIVADSNNNDYRIDDTQAIPLDVWTHYVGVYDGGEQRLYRDNTVVGSTTWSDTIHKNTGDVAIGSVNGSDDVFDGRLDEFRIYERALSDSEIQTLFEEGG